MPSSQQLYLFDCDRQVDIAVPNQAGSIVIGRDSILQCNDSRISRSHGILKLDANRDGGGLQITSTHSNPIFIRTGADGVLNILAKDLTATLQKGDKFALLPDQYWYEVRLREEKEVPEVTGEEVTSTGPTLRVRTMEEVNSGPISDEVIAGEKRKNVEDSEADCSKKIRTEDQETSDQPPAEANPAPETTSSEATSEPTIKPDPDASEDTPAEGTSSKSPHDSTATPPEVKKETPDSSTGPPLRPSCQFGIACYRHTPDHRAQFAHPHDTDYRRPTFPPAPADAPHCPFGASCYRRNPQHFRDLQHPDSSEYEATVVPPQAPAAAVMNRVIQVPLINVNALPTRRRANQFARDVLMAAIVNGVGADDDTESDGDGDDDGRSLFGSGSDSDEYNPDGEDDDDYGGHSESEQEEEEEEQRDEE